MPLPPLELAARLALDVVALAILAGALFHRRHGRMDLVVVYVLFNVGLFLALVIIAGGEIGVGVGFGLFAVLSIVRLRSEPYSNRELAYFFMALVLALVCAPDLGSPALPAALAAVAVAAAWLIDHPRLGTPVRQAEVTLEVAEADEAVLRGHLEARLGARVTDVLVREIDFVREMTLVSARYLPREAAPAGAVEEAAPPPAPARLAPVRT